jgi:succinyl-diaminopimelate desuccinylase
MIDMADGVIHLHINIRYPVTCDGTDVSGKIRDLAAKHGVGFSGLRDSKPIYIPAESDLVHLCMETIGSVFHRDWQPYTMGGGTYARKMTNAYALGPEDPDFESPFGIAGGGAISRRVRPSRPDARYDEGLREALPRAR